MPMDSKSTPSTKPATKKTCAIKRCRIYRWLRLKLFACLQKLSACLQKLWQSRPHPLTFIQRQWHTISLVILYIFFRPTFETHIAPLFSQFDPSFISTCFWYGIIIVGIVYTIILIRRKYVLSEKVLLWALVILLGWWYYRFKGIPNYEVTKIPAEWTPQYISNIDLLYIDLLLVIGGCIIVVQVFSWARPLGSYLHRPWKRKQANRDAGIEGYIVDYPITAEDEDRLGRSKKAFDLAKKIFHTDTSKAAFTLGLTAPWGAGKTSFMLAMQQYLRDNHCSEIILIEFNPWMYRKAPNLTQIFFEELSRALAPYSSALASGFMQYVDYILSKENNTWIQLGARLLPQGFKAKSTSEQYKFLEKEIGKLRRKIVIFIDDVDRLDSEELIELFSLVRNISPFPNMSYILAYDKEYVATQLQKQFDEHTNRYMEKIVQAEYPLAKITPEQLKEAFAKELVNVSSTYNRLATHIISSIKLEDYLPTLRAIKQICNALSSRRKELEGNVAPFDWFIIELIRIRYPDLFHFLKGNYEQILSCYIDRWNIKLEVEEFHTHLQGQKVNIQHRDTCDAFILMNLLWGQKRKAAPCQANHRFYIERYFNGILRATEIDESEFHKHMSLPFDKSYIEEKLRKGQLKDFARKLRLNSRNIKSTEEAEIYLRTAFYIGSIGYTTELFERYDIDDLILHLKDNLDNEEELKKKIEDIFNDPELKLGVLLYLSMVTIMTYDPDPSFTLKLFGSRELRSKKEELFLGYIEEHSLSPDCCYLLWCECRTYEQDELNSGKPIFRPTVCQSTKMDGKIKEIIEENIEKIIPRFIEGSHGFYRLLLPEPIWSLAPQRNDLQTGNFQDFIDNLDSNHSPIIKEFKEFLTRWIHREEEADEDILLHLSMEEREQELSHVNFKFKYITPAGIAHIINTHQYLRPYDYD